MELATGNSVQSSRGGRLFRRDEPHAEKLGGDSIRTGGRLVSARPIYVGIALIVAGACSKTVRWSSENAPGLGPHCLTPG
jgi:hypothetical protein